MPKRQPSPVYLIMQATGDLEFASLNEAIEVARKDLVNRPGTTYFVVQKLVTVAPAEPSDKRIISKHY